MDLFYEGIEYRLPADSIPWTASMNHHFHLNRITIETSPTGRCMRSFFILIMLKEHNCHFTQSLH